MTDFCETCGKKLDKKRGQTKFCCLKCYWKSLAKKHPHNYKKFKYNFLCSNARDNKIYRSWTGMLIRCSNKNVRSYKDYGGRGITVCDEWKNDFMSFYNWAINNGYKDGLTIERIDVNGNYEPNNCTWITMEEQAKNKRNNVKVFYNNEEMILKDIAIKENLNYKELWGAYKRNNNDISKAIEICHKHSNGLIATNKSGHRGVYFYKNKWVAYYNNKYIGRYKNFDEAVQARLKAEKQDKKE